jgi:hypothetical protein
MISISMYQGKDPSAHPQLNFFEEQWVKLEREKQLLLHFNDRLDAKANVFFLNETFIADLIKELDDHISIRNDCYWWTLARINEMALVCAENYANNCEFSLVGDLLINPRLVLVHAAGFHQPVAKERHLPLSAQFQDVGGDLREIRNWLKTKTLVEVKTEALLPDLFKKLEGSGRFDQEYLHAVERRKRGIADLIGYLASGGIADHCSLLQWLKSATPGDRKLMESLFCPLDYEWFFEMGRRVREWGSALSPAREILPIAAIRSSQFEA